LREQFPISPTAEIRNTEKLDVTTKLGDAIAQEGTKVMVEISKADWKLFRDRIGTWQEIGWIHGRK
jgi:hypothetical protein